MPADQLLTEGRAWLRHITSLQGQRLTLKQHREILILAGWVALLVGCVEYDMGNRHAAETTRQAALSLGVEADHAEIIAWGHEMRAWMNLTTGNYHGVIAATRNGTEITPHHSVAVQLFAQEAKAWARMGDRAEEVIEANTDFDGLERAPMRMAEARITLGVVRARGGDLDGAVSLGIRALVEDRKSLPTLLMVSRDLTKVLHDRYSGEAQTQDCLDQLTALTRAVLELVHPVNSGD
jgi:hypothetical protein